MGRSPLRKKEDLRTGAHDLSTLAAFGARRQGTTFARVIRRSFRIGLWLGLLVGIGFALSKILRSRAEPSAVIDLGTSTPAGAHQWPPLEAAVPTPTPVPVPEPEVEPVVATAEPGLITIGDEPLQEPEPEVVAPPAPAPTAPAKKQLVRKKAATTKAAHPKKTLATWIDPDGNLCPDSHPVKAKLSSMIFQVPGNFAYDRTKPDRCYETATAAESDGLRPAKR